MSCWVERVVNQKQKTFLILQEIAMTAQSPKDTGQNEMKYKSNKGVYINIHNALYIIHSWAKTNEAYKMYPGEMSPSV